MSGTRAVEHREAPAEHPLDRLTPEQIEEIGAQFKQLHDEVFDSLGDRDARYIRLLVAPKGAYFFSDEVEVWPPAEAMPAIGNDANRSAPLALSELKAFALEHIAEHRAELRRQALYADLPARISFIEASFGYQEVELAESRTRMAERVAKGATHYSSELAKVKKRQKELEERKAEALAVVQREPALIVPGEVTFLAHALVVPSTEPEDSMRYDADVEAKAVRLAIAHEEALGAGVQDVSTAARALDAPAHGRRLPAAGPARRRVGPLGGLRPDRAARSGRRAAGAAAPGRRGHRDVPLLWPRARRRRGLRGALLRPAAREGGRRLAGRHPRRRRRREEGRGARARRKIVTCGANRHALCHAGRRDDREAAGGAARSRGKTGNRFGPCRARRRALARAAGESRPAERVRAERAARAQPAPSL